MQGPKHRSEEPRYPSRYCGVVISDHGSFELPLTMRLPLYRTRRESLFDKLVTGCRYRIVVAGLGPRLEPGMPPSLSRNRTLLSAIPIGECKTLGLSA